MCVYAGVECVPAFFTHSHVQQESIHDYGDPLVLLLHPSEPMESAINRWVSSVYSDDAAPELNSARASLVAVASSFASASEAHRT